MTDRTHPHDTSTPAMSAETVPSEEFVLVPREAEQEAGTGSMRHDNEDGGIVMVACGQCQGIGCDFCDGFGHFNRPVRPTLSASRLAKEGGEAGAVEPIEKHRIANRLRGMFDMSVPSEGDFNRLTSAGFRLLRQAHDALIAPDEAVAAPVPTPSPAAKGGDAVQEAAQAVINSATNTYRKRNGQRGTIEGDDGEMAWIVPFDPFEELRAALSTPTEGPASQAEGMGEEAAADGSQAPLSDGRHRHLSRITEIVRGADSRMEAEQIALGYLRGAMSNEERAERAARDWAVAKWHEEVANRPLQNTHRRSLDTTWRQVIRYFGGDDERICGPRHDDLVATHDGMDFATPGTQVKPLEWQRFDNARTVTYRAMCPLGGIYYITSANEDPSFDGWKSHLGEFASLEAAKAAQQAEHEAKVRGCLARAALTPPETAEAVPDACHADDIAVDSFAVAMKAKLAEARAKGKGGWNDETECSRQYLSDELRRHALKPDPLDVANFAMFLHQRGETIAPVTDDRERLVEALRPFANAVFNDNGDMTVSPVTDYDAYVNAYFARRAALATEASR